MSNCVVRSRGPRLPCSIVADHGIESGDHFSHDGDDNDFGFLVGCGETVVEDFMERQAHSRSIGRGGCGLPVATGAMA